MAKQKQDDQPEPTYSSYVRTRDVTQKTCRRRWMIGRSGERCSGISVLAARHDDDDDDDIGIIWNLHYDQPPSISSPQFNLFFISSLLHSVFSSLRSLWCLFCVAIFVLIRWWGMTTRRQLHVHIALFIYWCIFLSIWGKIKCLTVVHQTGLTHSIFPFRFQLDCHTTL